MNHINITVELCAEDRARLDNIIGLLAAQVETELKVPKTAPKSVEEAPKEESRATIQAEPEAAPAPKSEHKAVETEPPAEPKNQKAPEVGLEELQGLVVRLATGGKKLEARDIVFEYAKSVTGVPAEKRGELYARLQELEV